MARVTTRPDPFREGHVELTTGPVPLHYQVYRHLRDALAAGRLRPGDRLPGERELCDFYGCSLVTVRRALDELARERRLVRERGRGTFVTEPPLDRNLALLGSFTEEMRARGLDPSTRVLAAAREPAPRAIADALRLDEGADTYLLERLRLVGGNPLLLEEVHLSADRFPGLLDFDLANESLYELLSQRYGVRLEHAQETIEPIALPTREAELLDQRRGRPALLVELVAFDQDDDPVEHCRSVVRGDRARYHVRARGARAELLVLPNAEITTH
ncbi:GntR family transcriptional regulator [Actinomadura decatromicini]|uniref:GntR family transcriptional regulator n=1 Tax=Actinomadura decatromicini TaxID=2604572 RepID=A0A5D3FZR8_9ACTN|nr:GntR family transcriptional regulator [Actinomadura decatromicini]